MNKYSYYRLHRFSPSGFYPLTFSFKISMNVPAILVVTMGSVWTETTATCVSAERDLWELNVQYVSIC